MKRIALFIDGLNVRFRLRERGWCEYYDVNHLAKELAGPRELVKALYYHPRPNQEQLGPERYAKERAYLERVARDEAVLTPAGAYMVKRERWVDDNKAEIWIEKQTDVLLASDLLYMAAKGSMDTAIVATADADLVPAIRRCSELGVPVEVLRFRGVHPRIYELESVAVVLRRARPAYFKPYDADEPN
ncbi:MAG: NYN domain-containing protein [Dehalococcoidia bacterium]